MPVVLRLVATVALCVMPALASGQPQQQEEYVPLNQLPPTEQLASAPLLVGAYAFVLVALFLYLLSLARRMTAVQRDVERLEADLKRTGRA